MIYKVIQVNDSGFVYWEIQIAHRIVMSMIGKELEAITICDVLNKETEYMRSLVDDYDRILEEM